MSVLYANYRGECESCVILLLALYFLLWLLNRTDRKRDRLCPDCGDQPQGPEPCWTCGLVQHTEESR